MTTEVQRQLLSDLPIPPGETLAEEIEFIGMTQQELAREAGLSPELVHAIIQGEAPITETTAERLEKVLGVPSHLWVNLETRYQLTKARLEEREGSRQSHTRPNSLHP